MSPTICAHKQRCCNYQTSRDVPDCNITDLKIRGQRQQRKRRWKSESAFFQSLSRLHQVTNFVKCRWPLPILNSYQPSPSLKRERKFLRRLCTSSVKREIRHFHIVVVQWRQLLFWLLSLLLLWRSRCRRRRRIFRSQLVVVGALWRVRLTVSQAISMIPPGIARRRPPPPHLGGSNMLKQLTISAIILGHGIHSWCF